MKRKQFLSVILVLSMVVSILHGGYHEKKAKAAGDYDFAIEIEVPYGGSVNTSFSPTFSERGVTDIQMLDFSYSKSGVASVPAGGWGDNYIILKAENIGETTITVRNGAGGTIVRVMHVIVKDPNAPTIRPEDITASPGAVLLRTEIDCFERKTWYFDKPLSAYGIDVSTMTWWGYSDGPSGIVGFGSWTDNYIEISGSSPGTVALNWKSYDPVTYATGDYVLKIVVTVRDFRNTPAPSAPAHIDTPTAAPGPSATDSVPAATADPGTPAQSSSVGLSKTSVSVQKGKSVTISLKNASGKVSWTSADKKIATVSGGKITGKKIGTTKITAKSDANGTYTCKVTVTGASKKLSASNLTLTEGKKKKLSLKKLTKKQTKKVQWSSSDASVASVKSGTVTAKKTGVTKISASYENRTYACTVYVDPKTAVAVKTVKFTKEKSVTAKKDSDAVLGNVENDGYSLQVPAGTFSADTKVAAKASGTGIDFTADGKDELRLEESVTVSMKLKKKIPAAEIPYYYVVYKKDGKEYLIEPDPEELRKGYVVFRTDHFSLYDFVKPGIKQVIKHKAYYAAAYKFSADTIDGFMEKAFQKSFDKFDQTLDYLIDKLSDGKLDRTDSFLKKRLKNSLFRDAEFIGICRGLATGDKKTAVKNVIDLCAKKLFYGMEKDKTYKKTRAAAMALPDGYKQWKSGNGLTALKTVSDAVSGEVDEVSATQFAYAVTLMARETYNDRNIQTAVQGLLGTKEGEDAGYHGGYNIKEDKQWEEFKKYDMKGAYRQYRETEMEKWREMKRFGRDLSNEEKQTPGILDQRLIKYSKQNYYTDPELAAERQEQEKRLDGDLRSYLLNRLEQEEKIREEAAKLEEQIGAYINAGLFGYEDELDYSEEEYSARIVALTEIKDIVEAKFDGTTPGQLEGYDSKTAYSVDCRRYAEFVKLYLDANERAKDETGAAGIKALTEELAKRYGVGMEISPQSFVMNLGDKDSFTVIVDGLFDIISQCKLSTFDKKAVSVSAAGEITALSDGEGDISVKYGKKTHKVHVLSGEGNLHINPVGYTELKVGATQSLSLRNADGNPVRDVPEWKSSDEKVMTVDSSGKVSALKGGTVTITALYHKKEYTKKFTVKQNVELTYKSLTLTVGDSKKLTLLGATAAKVSWGFSGSAGVITITKHGKVTAKSAGKVTVVATYEGKDYKCTVTVKKKVSLEGTYAGTYKSYDPWDGGEERTGECEFVVAKKTGTDSTYIISIKILTGGGGAGYSGSPDLSEKNGIINVKSSDKDYKGTGEAHFRVDGTNLVYYQKNGSRYINASGAKKKATDSLAGMYTGTIQDKENGGSDTCTLNVQKDSGGGWYYLTFRSGLHNDSVTVAKDYVTNGKLKYTYDETDYYIVVTVENGKFQWDWCNEYFTDSVEYRATGSRKK